jgi:hypothetical protein
MRSRSFSGTFGGRLNRHPCRGKLAFSTLADGRARSWLSEVENTFSNSPRGPSMVSEAAPCPTTLKPSLSSAFLAFSDASADAGSGMNAREALVTSPAPAAALSGPEETMACARTKGAGVPLLRVPDLGLLGLCFSLDGLAVVARFGNARPPPKADVAGTVAASQASARGPMGLGRSSASARRLLHHRQAASASTNPNPVAKSLPGTA